MQEGSTSSSSTSTSTSSSAGQPWCSTMLSSAAASKPRPAALRKSPSSKDCLALLGTPSSSGESSPRHHPPAPQRSIPLKCGLYLLLLAALLGNLAWATQQWHGRGSASMLAWLGNKSTTAQVPTLGQSQSPVLLQRPSMPEQAVAAPPEQQPGASIQGLDMAALEAIGIATIARSHAAVAVDVAAPAPEPEPAAATGIQHSANRSSTVNMAASRDKPEMVLLVNPVMQRKANASELAASTVPEAGAQAASATAQAASTQPATPAAQRWKKKGRPLTATLQAPETLPQSEDPCNQVLGIPRVALLFLTKGELFHEPTWRLWFKSAAGLLPAPSARDVACAPDAELEALEDACAPSNGRDGISQQHLFSVYIHAPPSFNLTGFGNVTEYPEGSLWRGRLIQRRIYPSWGDISLVEATRYLLWEAYKDPLNTRFLLISESGMPMYDPLTLYAQLMSESRSRVLGCPRGNTDASRWTWRMQLPNMKRSHWRKSSQWFVLQRDHARVVLEDVAVYRKFEEWCTNGWDGEYRRWRGCYPDEHYIPTLLGGVHGLSHQMQCESGIGVSAVDWSRGGAHPREYTPDDLTPDTITSARIGNFPPCDATQAHELAQQQFVSASEALGVESRNQTCASLASHPPSYNAALSEACWLTIRKLPKPTVAAVYELFTNCTNGLGLLSYSVCDAAEPLSLQ